MEVFQMDDSKRINHLVWFADKMYVEEEENDSDGNWKCTFCGKKSKNRGHLKEHAEVHIDGLTFPDCDYISRSSSGLRQHGYKHKK